MGRGSPRSGRRHEAAARDLYKRRRLPRLFQVHPLFGSFGLGSTGGIGIGIGIGTPTPPSTPGPLHPPATTPGRTPPASRRPSTRYEPPFAPGRQVGGVPAHSGPQRLTDEDKQLHKQLLAETVKGSDRLVPQIR
jgi:hypothetical protein